MTILFLTLSKSFLNPDFVSQRGIYTDLLREFEKNGHRVYVVAPAERRNMQDTRLIEAGPMHLLQVKTGNIKNTNPIEKGISTVLLERQFVRAIKKHLNVVKFDLVLFSTPPITFERVVRFIKKGIRPNLTFCLRISSHKMLWTWVSLVYTIPCSGISGGKRRSYTAFQISLAVCRPPM